METRSDVLAAPVSAAGGLARTRSVLIVDDETGVRELMCRWLEAGGYTVRMAASADEALDQLAACPPAVALCDIRMPGHDGLWLAERIRHAHPETAVIMATGVQEAGAAVESIRQGAVDYLTKPFGRERLRETVARGFEWHQTAWDARRWRETLEDEMNRRRRGLADAMGSVHVHNDETQDAMLWMLTSSDREACAHAHRVADLARRLARALFVPNAALSVIGQAALLHDLGKLAMPEAILRKPAPLTMEEQGLVRQHPVIGAELVGAVPYLSAAAPLISAVRERMDGHGYPDGVAADRVPLGARIIAVADAYDTMTRPRVFRSALSAGEAMLELERCRGTQFDPVVVDALKALPAPDGSPIPPR